MGWNKGYTIMEKQVVKAYDTGVLNKELLNTIMEPFIDSDIDHGGSRDLKAKDGKSADEIICFIMEPERYKEAKESWTPDPDYPDDPYNEKLHDLYYEITRREWDFW